MPKEGVQPDDLVFTHLFTTCNYSGLIDEGLWCFHSLSEEYGIEPYVLKPESSIVRPRAKNHLPSTNFVSGCSSDFSISFLKPF